MYNGRFQKGGDLYTRPLTRAEMTAPLAWHEKQLGVVRRFGELADGTVGYEIVHPIIAAVRANCMECQAESMISVDLVTPPIRKIHALLIRTLVSVHFNKAMTLLALEALS